MSRRQVHPGDVIVAVNGTRVDDIITSVIYRYHPRPIRGFVRLVTSVTVATIFSRQSPASPATPLALYPSPKSLPPLCTFAPSHAHPPNQSKEPI
jgi:hypothetical protein